MTENEEQHYHHAPEKTELEKFFVKILDKLEPYASQILIGCLAVTVVAVGAILFFRSADATQSASWQRFVECRAAEDFEDLAGDYPDTTVGHWAALQAGRLYLEEGLNQALTNRETSDERLGKAKESFEDLLDKETLPEIREEALYGLATTLESLSDGDLQPAISAYEELVQLYPESQHFAWANERISHLKSEDAKEFYAWFRTTNPKPADRPGPQDMPSSIPSLDDLPDIELPPVVTDSEESSKEENTDSKDDSEKAAPFPAPEESKPEEPATDDAASNENPPPAPSNDEKPTDTETDSSPVTEVPSDDAPAEATDEE